MSDVGDYRRQYAELREEYGLLSCYVDDLRDLIIQAVLHGHLASVHKNELLSLVDEIDQERQALVGSA